jgi:hypothetical protein
MNLLACAAINKFRDMTERFIKKQAFYISLKLIIKSLSYQIFSISFCYFLMITTHLNGAVTFSIMSWLVTLSINETQHNRTESLVPLCWVSRFFIVLLSIAMLRPAEPFKPYFLCFCKIQDTTVVNYLKNVQKQNNGWIVLKLIVEKLLAGAGKQQVMC